MEDSKNLGTDFQLERLYEEFCREVKNEDALDFSDTEEVFVVCVVDFVLVL